MRSRHPRSVLASLAGAIAAVSLVVPGAADAAPATLSTDARCYLQGGALQMTAGGLTPHAALAVTLDGQRLHYEDGTSPTADDAGSFAGSFATPALAADAVQQRHVLTVEDGAHRPRARFTVTRSTGAKLEPASGDPRTLRARVQAWGFALAAEPGAAVWLHWVAPSGKARRTVGLGTPAGDCGTLATQPRRVFPFAPAPGRWLLVLDTHRRYRVQATGPRAKISLYVPPQQH